MQQFTVPQFIDVEDKIIGPITTRQFLILLFCFLIIAIFYKAFDFTLFVVASVIWFGICGVLAFARINGRPFHYFILNLIQTFKKPGLRVWDNQKTSVVYDDKNDEEDEVKDDLIFRPKPKVNKSRLAELSLIVDTHGNYQGNEMNTEKIINF